VIYALAEQSSGKKQKQAFVPYRDSVLTWFLFFFNDHSSSSKELNIDV
jgi:hypothetical protein